MFRRRESRGPIDTLIGRNASVQGDVEFSGGLHIDGRVNGSVRSADGAAGALSISEHGSVEGSVEAARIVLNGQVSGDIFGAERVVLGAKARVRGNVYYGEIEMEQGAEINGKLIPRNGSAEPVDESQ